METKTTVITESESEVRQSLESAQPLEHQRSEAAAEARCDAARAAYELAKGIEKSLDEISKCQAIEAHMFGSLADAFSALSRGLEVLTAQAPAPSNGVVRACGWCRHEIVGVNARGLRVIAKNTVEESTGICQVCEIEVANAAVAS